MVKEHDASQAIAMVYKEHFATVYRIAYGVLRNSELTEDVCQEVFIKYAHHHDRLSQTDYVKHWLMRVAKNLAINVSKRREREKKSYQRLFIESKKSEASADTDLMKQETIDTVKTAIDLLPNRYREIVIMREYGGASYKDIARVLNTTENNVKVHMFRARKKIAEILINNDEKVAYESIS